jgi:type I restriction enzyme S subunit
MSIKSGDTLTNELITDDETKYPVYGGGKLIGYYDRYNITTSNILIGRVGANCGCITITEQNGWATDNALVVCPVCDKQYLYYLLIANNLNSINESNAQPLITATKVMNQKTVYVNSISEQRAIAAFLDTRIKKTDNIITEKRQSIETMKTYKKSLIYEYVTGKKRVKGYS